MSDRSHLFSTEISFDHDVIFSKIDTLWEGYNPMFIESMIERIPRSFLESQCKIGPFTINEKQIELPPCCRGVPSIELNSMFGCIAFAIDKDSALFPGKPFPIQLTQKEYTQFLTTGVLPDDTNRTCFFCDVFLANISHKAYNLLAQTRTRYTCAQIFSVVPNYDDSNVVDENEGFHHSHVIIPNIDCKHEDIGPLYAPVLSAESLKYIKWKKTSDKQVGIDISRLTRPKDEVFQ
jgi:hypothetical protein